MNHIYSKFAGDEYWNELLAEFVAAMPHRIASLKSAVAASDQQSLRVIVHQLKGACGSYGFDAITPLAEQLEQSLLHESESTAWPIQMAAFVDALESITHPSTATQSEVSTIFRPTAYPLA